MKFRALILRSLRYHWRSHLGVVIGAAIGSAALIGALIVGDSVKGSLRERALERLGWVEAAMDGGDRLFTKQFAEHIVPINADSPSAISSWNYDAVLKLPAIVTRQDGAARANAVNLLGVGYRGFWQPARLTNSRPDFALIPKDSVVLNEALASHLHAKPGDDLLFRLHKPGVLSQDMPVTPRDDATITLRLKVHGIAPPDSLGDFSLRSGQTPPMNAFLLINDLASAAGLPGKANLILEGDFRTDMPTTSFRLEGFWRRIRARLPGQKPASNHVKPEESELTRWWMYMKPTLADLSLDLHTLTNLGALELRTDRIFIEPAAVNAVLSPAPNRPDAEAAPQWAAMWNRTTPSATNLLSEQLVTSNAQPVLTYLANMIMDGTNATPYSMVTAAGAPWTPSDLKDDEIVISQWLADDLSAKPGDTLALVYFDPESGARLEEKTNTFRVQSVVPMEMPWADRTLMPQFPGIEKAETTADWDTAFPLVYTIRPQDEEYWTKYRGTPKAFITLAAGQKMWANRFGNLTAIRFPIPTNVAEPVEGGAGSLRPAEDARGASRPANAEVFRIALEERLLATLKPEELGLRFEPVREQALKAAEQSQDFGGLFIGFSLFVIVAALLLMALLFQFGVEQRTSEIGTYLALGFTPRQVRRLFFREGVALAFIGGIIGTLGGIGYARAMLLGLTTLWRDAVGASTLGFFVTSQTLLMGLFASTLVAAFTLWFTLRKQAKQPVRTLLSGNVESGDVSPLSQKATKAKGASTPQRPTLPGTDGRASALPGWLPLAIALGLVAWALMTENTANAGIFFGAGSLVLISGLAFMNVRLRRPTARPASMPSLAALAFRGLTRRRSRSVATAAMLASGAFLIVSVGVFRLDANHDATLRSSGTGGFALIGESTMPVVADLNTKAGRESFALSESDFADVNLVQFRVHQGDEASCLNLNRAQRPRLMGVIPEQLAGRFKFAKGAGWNALRSSGRETAATDNPPTDQRGSTPAGAVTNEIPAIGDAASIQWAMGKKVGDTLDYVDERGRPFKVRIVGAVANSILQGQLMIDEAEFVKRFPSESGYEYFLIDAPTHRVADVSAKLSRALQDVGLEVTFASVRLAQFNAVQNTYLGTFQILGGLGLLLGSAGLGIVVLRNVLERRGELAVLLAVGWRQTTVRTLVLLEHAALLGLGLAVGLVASAIAVLPGLVSAGTQLPYITLSLTLALVLANGFFFTWFAVRFALRGDLLAALRNE